MSDLVGRTLGPYEIVGEIGHGGMANVYRAVQPSIGREVAIKVLPAHFLQDRTFLERFNREVKVIAHLQHPRILPVYDFGQDEGMPYIVMAYMPGGTLARRIQRDGGVPVGDTVRLVGQIAEGLDYAHEQGIIHRDFKPSNVLLDKKGNPYLADFGIAKVTEATAQLTGSGMVGTPAYMAPEMTRRGGVTHLVDVYALGVTLFQMLTGALPYEADTPMGTALAHVTEPIPDVRDLRPDLPETVQAVIERAMAKDPMDRYQSAGELAADLGNVMGVQEAVLLQPAVPPPVQVPPSALEAPTVDQPHLAPVSATTPMPAPTPAPSPVVERATPPAVSPRPGGSPWVGRVIIGVIVMGLLAAGAALLVRSLGGAKPAVMPTPTPPITLLRTAVPSQETDTPTVTPIPPGFTPVTHNADWAPIIQEFDGVQMVLVPAGCFMMGSDQGNPDERPVHQQCFDRPFWIDVTEVTNARFGSAWDSSGDDYPREAVKWFHARDYCKDRGTRLPTEAEWEYAARGPNSLRYPWGDTFEGNNLVYSGNSNGHSAPVGGRQGGVSWVGALDLVGNVWEWVSSIYRPYPYDASDGREDASDQTSIRVWRGGSYSSYAEFLNPTARRNGDPSWEYNNGFRCARDWSPSDTTP